MLPWLFLTFLFIQSNVLAFESSCSVYGVSSECRTGVSPVAPHEGCVWDMYGAGCVTASEASGFMSEDEYRFFIELKSTGYSVLSSWNPIESEKLKCSNFPSNFHPGCSILSGRMTSLTLKQISTSTIPDSFGVFDKLFQLSIYSTLLTTLPPTISNLTSLILFDISMSPNLVLPDSFVQIPNLMSMSAVYTKLSPLPANFGNLESLSSLSLTSTSLSTLPISMEKLTNLLTLKVTSSSLSSLPDIFNNSILYTLAVDDNFLNSLPDSIGTISTLRFLHASSNNLLSLPTTFAHTKLSQIFLSNNPWLRIKETDLPSGKITLVSCSSTCSTASFVCNPDPVTTFNVSCTRSPICACTEQKVQEDCLPRIDDNVCWWDGAQCLSQKITPNISCSNFTTIETCNVRFWNNETSSVCLWSSTLGCINIDTNSDCSTFSGNEMCTSAIKRGAQCFWCSSLSQCQSNDKIECELCGKFVTKSDCPTLQCNWCENEEMCKAISDGCKHCDGLSQSECSSLRNCKYCLDSPVHECMNISSSCDTCISRNGTNTCTSDNPSSSSSSSSSLSYFCQDCGNSNALTCVSESQNCGSICYTKTVAECPLSTCKVCQSSSSCIDQNDSCQNCNSSSLASSSSCLSYPGCNFCVSSQKCEVSGETCNSCYKMSKDACKSSSGCTWCSVDNSCRESYRSSCSSCGSLRDKNKCGSSGVCNWCPATRTCADLSRVCRPCSYYPSTICSKLSGCVVSNGVCTENIESSKNSNSGIVAVAVIIPIVFCLAIGAFFVWRWHSKRSIQSDRTQTRRGETQTTVSLSKFTSIELGMSKMSSSNCIDVSGMKFVELSELGLEFEGILPLSFGDILLEVHSPYYSKIPLRNTKDSTFRGIIQYSPDEDNHSISFIKNTVEISGQQRKSIEITLTMKCTSSLGGQLQIVVEELRAFAVIPIKAQSSASCFLSMKDIDIGRKIGQGGFGAVYQGKYRGEDIAIKQFKKMEGSGDEGASTQEQMENEILLMSKLRSPYLVSFFGVVHTPSHSFIAMELCKYGTLRDYLEKEKVSDAFKIMTCIDISRGLHFLHSNKVIHRDLKPENVLLVSKSPTTPVRGKISDFGTSRTIFDTEHQKLTKGVGTPLFMAPELLENKNYSLPSDIYSLSLTFWFIWEQVDPFSELKSNFTLYQKVMDGVRPELNPKCPFSDLIKMMWSPEPSDRPTAEQVKERIECLEKTIQVSKK
eukprot:TRINITY_DN847_c1_g1_i1.p1 TRINITY_DN847_c1_g1~~TRINITY_DN847_c1_g1_i1.p1  ORF type:complete len:1221 (+),score=313.37 TRINITY_DN847_c1_g1_i1:47-3709(+)